MKLTTLIDNIPVKAGLKGEHGLSFLLEVDSLKIIFDVGQTNRYIDNAQKMGIDLADVDYVVLSHGHYDHAGGLPAFCKINSKAKILIHKKAFVNRYSKTDDKLKENGIPWKKQLNNYLDRIIMIDGDIQLGNTISILSNIEKHHMPVNNPRFVINEDDEYGVDCFNDEIILVCQADTGSVVLSGCAHNGIVNILQTVENRMGTSTFSLVAGGLHLSNADSADIKLVIACLSTFKVKRWGLNHCTGNIAYALFKDEFKNDVDYYGSGYVCVI